MRGAGYFSITELVKDRSEARVAHLLRALQLLFQNFLYDRTYFKLGNLLVGVTEAPRRVWLRPGRTQLLGDVPRMSRPLSSLVSSVSALISRGFSPRGR